MIIKIRRIKAMEYDLDMTPQEIFDTVVARLNDGTGQAKDHTGACKYLEEGTGNKCAVGLFIPDGHDAQNYHGSVSGLVYEYKNCGPRELPALIYYNVDLLSRLQRVHDATGNWFGNTFTGVGPLKGVAGEYNLSYTHGLEEE
jgi:hypothetical protein